MISTRSNGLVAAGLALTVLTALPSVAEDAPGSAWIGVWVNDAVDGGVRIVHVVEDGPAAAAGLQQDDLLIGAGDLSIVAREDLSRVLEPLEPGDTVTVRVLRGKQTIEQPIVVGRRGSVAWSVPQPRRPPAPDPVVSSGSVATFGLRVAEVPPTLRRHYLAPEDAGVLVMTVEEGTPAEKTGILVGDVLVEVGGAKIREARQIRQAVRAWNTAEPLVVRLVRKGEARVLQVSASTVGVAATPRAPEASARELVRNYREVRIEEQIRRLERELVELREELDRLRDDN